MRLSLMQKLIRTQHLHAKLTAVVAISRLSPTYGGIVKYTRTMVVKITHRPTTLEPVDHQVISMSIPIAPFILDFSLNVCCSRYPTLRFHTMATQGSDFRPEPSTEGRDDSSSFSRCITVF